MLLVFLLFALGLFIIIKGGDIFVDAAVWFAKVTGMPNILIGATVVSLATTLPELFVSTIASFNGAPEVAIGNAIGSTICNIGLILALSMIFMPGNVDKTSVRNKGLLMIGSTIVVMLLSLDKVMYFYEGLILLLLLIFYVYLNIKEVKSNKEIAVESISSEEIQRDRKIVITNISKFVLGSVLIVFGARLLVDNGIKIAEFLKVPQAVVSLTLIALGTSLPELITTITAIVKKHYDISVGNIIGANILNVTMILGTSSIFSSNGLVINNRTLNIFNNVYVIPQTLYIDIPVSLLQMIIVVLPAMLFGKLKRWQGITVLTIYISYLIFLGVSL
ncbi:calcium/sodium antiporter [Clostridium sp. SYSU_GA19001]|uniref:calcium/sodium antiporter n=1 Tax=Clostridium caldaquaticum TaxID=2940653 RepID=UPI0020779A79|nr:calcium/sodium antiporter [Clostridium caldaquaticum]MCM8712110.1 calcium/sodium antiporter [Clostridium caldaquaticum]